MPVPSVCRVVARGWNIDEVVPWGAVAASTAGVFLRGGAGVEGGGRLRGGAGEHTVGS